MHERLCGSSAVDFELTETGVAAPCAAHVFRFHRQSIAGLKPPRRLNVPHFFPTAPESRAAPFFARGKRRIQRRGWEPIPVLNVGPVVSKRMTASSFCR